jgi:hypothetical protein
MNSTYRELPCGQPSACTASGVERLVSRPEPSSAQ